MSFFSRTREQNPKISVGLGVVGTVTDFYIITIPLTAISGLNMSLARKIGVSTLFATGLLYVFPHTLGFLFRGGKLTLIVP